MRWPLHYQLLWPFAGVMALTLAVVSGVNAWLATRRAEEQIQSQLSNIGETLRRPPFQLTHSVLQQARGLSGAELVVTDSAGKLVASSTTSIEAGLHLATTASGAEGRGLGNTVTFQGEQYFHRAVETRGGDALGPLVLHVLYPERSYRESLRQAMVPPLVVGGIALAVVVLVAGSLASRLSRPIALLQQQVGRIAEGDFQPLPLPERDDELRDLAKSVNSLAQQLTTLTQVMKRSERLTLLGQLSGGLAHHLRNDITGVRLAIQLHQRKCRADDRESLEVALRQLALSEEYLQRLLAIGQPRDPERKACDLKEIAADLVVLHGPTFDHRKVKLQADLGERSIPLSADAKQLSQLLLNLLLNGIEAAGSGGWVRIETGILDEQRHAFVRLLDSGSGPPVEIEAKLFEPFATSKPEGVGLGLAVARQIARAHGGELVFSRNGEGATCFELRLPLA
ncbi:MAG: HAMP domain-containing histidine kinase [Pirellulaceae bacterium]|nr:HAMP domain-containing histidine kinase [Pirellulaceae bacterium]